MMRLYLAPGACSLAAHIALREAGLDFDSDVVDFLTKQTSRGEDFLSINPKGAVPALRLADGQILTELAVILQYIADRDPNASLAPRARTFERYRLQEWLNYIVSEIHMRFAPPAASEDWKRSASASIGARFDFLARTLEHKPYLMGDYTVADAYLFTMLDWTKYMDIDLRRWPALERYVGRVAARAAVQAALAAESSAS